MAVHPDFLVRSADYQPLLAVEVKTKTGATKGWAAELRRNLHPIFPKVKYFLLALPEHFHLWKDAGLDATLPDYQVDTADILAPYMRELDVSLRDISHLSLQFLVQSWLEAIVSGNKKRWAKNAATAQFIQSGLYEAVRGGQIDVEIAA